MMTDPAASRPGTHLDPDQMADLFEGLLEPGAADAARAHLAACPVCADDFALIAGEAADFGGWGDLLPPIPIPQDVVARVEAALHREPPLAPATAPASHAAQPPRRRRFRLALGSVAGATLVIAGGIGTFAALNSGDDSSKGASTSTVAEGGAPSTPPRADTSRETGQSASPGIAGAQPDAPTPKNFNSMNIPGQAEALLRQHAATPASGTTQPGPDCLVGTVAAGTKPLANAPIQYQGKQAVLLVYPEPGSTTVADVYVIDQDSCTSGNPAQILLQTTVPRP